MRTRLEDDFITSIGTRGTVYRTRAWERLSAALDELRDRVEGLTTRPAEILILQPHPAGTDAQGVL